MSQYHKSIKIECCCGAKLDLESETGHSEWLSEQSKQFTEAHRECPALRYPKVKLPEKLALPIF